MKRTICAVTTSRADYGLLTPLLAKLAAAPDLELQLVATGMHLSPEFGMTVRQIEQDGFTLTDTIETLLSSDTPVGIAKAIGLGIISFSECFKRLKPDIVVGLGDRFELFAAVTAAMIARIPVAHIHGGELTEGAIDEAFRHSITKMSHIHFTATEPYRQRVIQLGESPSHVFAVGALGVDVIQETRLLERQELEQSLGFRLRKKNFLITFHPVTLEEGTAASQFDQLLTALEAFPKCGLIFTHPNADTDGRVIIAKIEDFVQRNELRAVAFDSLGQLRYLSTMKHVDVVVGNSSSGILEAPGFKTPTVNIGDRQRGRTRAASIIDCPPDHRSIKEAIVLACSPAFRESLSAVENPYGTGGAAARMLSILREFPLEGILKKVFHDLNS